MTDSPNTTPEPETDAERIYRETGGVTPTLRAMFNLAKAAQRPHGCICPAGAEATCQGLGCPRRGFTMHVTSQGHHPR